MDRLIYEATGMLVAPPARFLVRTAVAGLVICLAASAAATGPPKVIDESHPELQASPLDRLMSQGGPRGGAGPLVVGEDELAERRGITDGVMRLLTTSQKDLNDLDTTLAHYRRSDERTKSGIAKFDTAFRRFDGSLYSDFSQKEMIDHAQRVIAAWKTLKPQSPFPVVLEAQMLINRATWLQWSRTARLPIAGVLEEPADHLKRAEAILDTVEGEAYAAIARIRIRAMQGAKPAEIMELIAAASEKFPTTLDLYGLGARLILATNPEPVGDLEAIASLAAVRGNREGEDAYYARTYWYALSIIGHVAVNALDVDWERFARGSRQIVQRYPAQWNYQYLASIACAGGQQALAAELFGGIAGHPIMTAWRQRELYDRCRNWALPRPQAKQ